MIKEINLNSSQLKETASSFFNHWPKKENKVFVFRSKTELKDVKSTYESFFEELGSTLELGEDASKGNRSNQRDGSIWFEVRNDKNFTDAYRHSQNAQPLHTDGSYIPGYPTTIMACEKNDVEDGETTFIDSIDIYNALLSEKPKILEKLESFEIKHERSGDKRLEKIIQKNPKTNDVLINWNYFCLSKDLKQDQRQSCDEFHDFLLTSPKIKRDTIEVSLQRGDSVLWKDSHCLHGRKSFTAQNDSDRFLLKCAIQINKN